MPVTPTYPGVYIEEIPSGVRTITGVATSVTAFIGPAKQGPTKRAVAVRSFADFERQFGGLWDKGVMGHMVQHFFLNGGSSALIIRAVNNAAKKAIANVSGLKLEAASPGEWMNGIMVSIDEEVSKDLLNIDPTLFNLSVIRPKKEQLPEELLEQFRNLSINPRSSRFITTVLEQDSSLVRVEVVPEARPTKGTALFVQGNDFGIPAYNNTDYSYKEALDKADIFNLLCIAPNATGTNVADDSAGRTLLIEALKYCEVERAILIVDPPTDWVYPKDVIADSTGLRTSLRNNNSVIYYPNPRLPNPLREFRLESFPPSGLMAGVMSRTDSQRGVWKAPAGTEATLTGVMEYTYKLNDAENGDINPLGVNCLRSFLVYGNVAWGARTLKGNDQDASEWKYLPVRRLALYLEESLYRGTQWVVFEPNDEPLWSQIRVNVGAFMNNLFRQGAFQGKTPREAYFVKCDSDTTTQNDIDRGIVNVLIGFAPLKPAEFVILKFQQIAGQLQV